MTTGTMRVTDPVGRAVELPEGLCLGGTADAQPPEIYNEYQKVVETPASIIERADGRLYYFRSLGWNFTVLIEVAWRGEGWYAVRCHKNPAPPDIAALLKDGTFVAGSSLEPPGS